MNHSPYNKCSNSLGLIHRLIDVDSKNPCSEVTSKALRSTIYAVKKSVDIFEFYKKSKVEPLKLQCLIAVSAIAGTAAGCTISIGTLETIVENGIFAVQLILDIFDRIYGEICTPGDDIWETSYQTARQDAIYDNSILNARNIITTFAATQQLKVMLGDVQAGLEDDREERKGDGRRLQEENCKDFDISRGFLEAPCNQTACQDSTRLCDGSYNYPYISELITG